MTEVEPRRPLRVALEGIDGVGKSTLLRALAQELGVDRSVHTESMAPVTLDLFKKFGSAVAGDPQAYWSAVSRRTKTQVFLTEGVVRAHYLADAYAAFDVVLLDRWWQTFSAYSDLADFDERCRFLRGALPEVDLVVHLRGDPGRCAARLVADDDWLVREVGVAGVAPFLQSLRDRYDALFGNDPTVLTIDVGDLSPDELLHLVLPAVRARLGVPCERVAPAPMPTSFRAPEPSQLIAIEGLDGAGKTTLVDGVTAAVDGLRPARLASASLALFKASVARRGSDPSVAIRDVFEDEFRHQTYLVDGLVGLACLADRDGPWLFDRWFPLTALYQDAISSDRPFFDYLLSCFPVPGVALYLDVEPADAVKRLQQRGDWMVRSLPEAAALQMLTDMRERQLACQARDGWCVLDASLPRHALVDQARKVLGR